MRNAAPAGVSAMGRIVLALKPVVVLDMLTLVSIVVLMTTLVVTLFGITMLLLRQEQLKTLPLPMPLVILLLLPKVFVPKDGACPQQNK